MPRSEDRILGERLNEAEAYTKFIESIRIAESSARQLAYLRNAPAWLEVENALARTRELAALLATAGQSRASAMPDLRRMAGGGSRH
jgi:hypothetical protein